MPEGDSLLSVTPTIHASSETEGTALLLGEDAQSSKHDLRDAAGPRGAFLKGTQSSLPSTTEGLNGARDDIKRARLALYASHALATWGQRMWEFAVGLVMLELQPGSLQLVAVSGLLGSLAGVLGGGAVGQYVDRTERLKAASSMYILQNAAICLSAVAVLAALKITAAWPVPFWFFTSLAILAGSISSVGCIGSAVSVEREWTKTLSQGNSDVLAHLNSGMQRIDLLCLIASPLATGLLMSAAGIPTAVMCIALWNIAAWYPECGLLRMAQARAPVLKEPPAYTADVKGQSLFSLFWGSPIVLQLRSFLQKDVQSETVDPGEPPDGETASGVASWASRTSWAAYARQPTVAVLAADALLYLTVMSLGLLMTAYLKWFGASEVSLAVWRGFGAAAGVAATYAFPYIRSAQGLDAAGLLSIWPQVTCLVVAVTPALLVKLGAQLPTMLVTVTLMAGVALSRYGLWCFDLAYTQTVQERVPPQELGTVLGVQGSMQSLLSGLSYVAGLIVPHPEDFIWLMVGSCAVITTAAVLYTGYAWPRAQLPVPTDSSDNAELLPT